jgi:hypothetical protein
MGLGCEDGPNQTYSPAPAGAGGVWNGPPATGGIQPDGGAFVPGATQDFDASVGGQNANELCTAAQEKDRWTNLFSMPILPPGLGGGLDLAGGVKGDGSAGYQGTGSTFTYDPTKETWTGTTVEQAEKILCQGTPDSIFYGETNTLGWGENLELSVLYNVNSRQITDLLFSYGYVGTVDATGSDGTKYSLTLNNTPISVTAPGGGMTELLLDWSNVPDLISKVNALWDALRLTYAPTFPAEMDCTATGHCIVGNNGAFGGYFWFTPINLAIFVNSTIGSPQVQSIFTLMDLGLLKLLPFSTAATTMKLDLAGEGPISFISDPIATNNKVCKYTLGMTFGDFDSNCVEPFAAGDANNTINKNKLFGAMSHGDEAYAFDVVGVDPQFAATLSDTTVVSDAQRPTANDVAYELRVDQEVLGPIANDFTNNDATQAKDWHGNGLITLEWANLVQQYMKAAYGVTSDLGDPACIADPVSPGVMGKVCSGIEGIVTTAPPSVVPASMAVNALGPVGTKVGSRLKVGLKPGTWYSLFCRDGGGLSASGAPVGYKDCLGAGHTPTGGTQASRYFFDTMQNAVGCVMSGQEPGCASPGPGVPETLANRRFYFQQWILAVVKYLQTADNPKATLAQIDANPVDVNELFFDSAGGGFENAEYVFRGSVNSAKQAPTTLRITVNLTTSVINDFTFTRYNFRGEKALYTALTTDATDLPGAEPLYLSNVVGSPVLMNTYGTYDCAVNLDPKSQACGGVTGPTDAFGKPLFTGYKPAFGASVLNIAANGFSPPASPMTVSASDFTLLQSAMVTLPIWQDPFDPTTATASDPTVSELLPYFPKGANVGFPVTIDGSRDKFYNTNSVDFTGSTLNAVVDYETISVTDPTTNMPTNELVIRAVESQEYLGLVFACAEPNPVTGNPDVLAVRMYQNAQDILDWIAFHPSSVTDCNVQIKYSIYGNYADFISFLTSGVRFGLNPGFGGSVVSDATLFDPNVLALLGQ